MLYLHICVFVFVYLQVRHQGPLFLRSFYHYLFKNIAHVMCICDFDQYYLCVFVYLCIYIFVFESQTARNIVSEALLPLPFQKYSKCNVYLQLWPMLYLRICVFVYLCICVFVYLYLCICKPDTQEHCFWGPLTITFFKNVAHVMSICNFDQCCICVFVFASQTPGNIIFEVLVSSPLRKYMVYMV